MYHNLNLVACKCISDIKTSTNIGANAMYCIHDITDKYWSKNMLDCRVAIRACGLSNFQDQTIIQNDADCIVFVCMTSIFTGAEMTGTSSRVW